MAKKTKPKSKKRKRRHQGVKLDAANKEFLKLLSESIRSVQGAPKLVAEEVRDLRKRWRGMSPCEKGEGLEKLLPNFASGRALGEAMGRTEGRLRQLLKVAPGAKQTERKPDATISEPKHDDSASVLPATVSQRQPEAPHAEQKNKVTIEVKDGQLKQAAPVSPRAALTVQEPSKPLLAREVESGTTAPPHGSAKQPAAVSKEHDPKTEVQPPVLDRKEQGEPKSRESKSADLKSATSNNSKAGEPAVEAAVQDYAIKDPEVGGKLVATWIRFTVKPRYWTEVIEDYTAATWFARPSLRDAGQAKDIPGGLTPCEVIKHCLSQEIKEQLEGDDFQNARRKWFVCWASILLPDPATRRKSVEIAGRILQEPAPRWQYLAYDMLSKQPIPIVASQRIHLADFLEGLTKYVNLPGLLRDGGPVQAEVEEALRYAAATLREGCPPRID